MKYNTLALLMLATSFTGVNSVMAAKMKNNPKKNLLLSCLIIFILSLNSMAQTKEANPADVASLDAIMKAVYDVISGDAGKARDWDRFRTLFYKDARMIPTGLHLCCSWESQAL